MKKFIWCERSNNRVTAIKGPNKKEWKALIGESYIHTLEDLCKLPISDILKYRLDSANDGVMIGVHHLHSNVDLAVRKLGEHEIETMKEEKRLKISLAEVVALIEKKEPTLHAQKVNIEKQLEIARKKIKEMNLEGVDP